MMKKIFIAALLFLSFQFLLAHDGEFITVKNIDFKIVNDDYLNISFNIINKKQIPLTDVTVSLKINGNVIAARHYDYLPPQKNIYSSILVKQSKIDTLHDFIQIDITRLFGKTGDWGGWDSPNNKQVNEVGYEVFADAPWRMDMYDTTGNLQGIPVHIFVHDADGFGNNVELQGIDISIKNSASSVFNTLSFNSYSTVQFNALFSTPSPLDTDLDIQPFDQNTTVKSSQYTIQFIADTNLLSEVFTDITHRYWYFTFYIPPEKLQGYGKYIDIEVFFYLNFAPDRYTRLRVFRNNTNDFPKLPGWYRGDTHLHSLYTQNSAEIGLPLEATKQAAKLIGLDWITTTDHTSDFDNYGTSITNNWNRLKNDVITLNNQDTSLIFIRGQEVHSNNSDNKIIHMLAYPSFMNPYLFPYLGDGGGDTSPTNKTIDGVLGSLTNINGFGFAAHPFATGDKLPTIPVNGGIWNLGVSNFPDNTQTFPKTGGNIICNDPSLPSDVFSTNPSITYVKNGLRGGQIWNVRQTLSTTDDAQDPWDVLNAGASVPFTQVDTADFNFHFKRFRQGQEVINFINQQGLFYKNMYPNVKNWKFYYAAGSDAHGSFNYSNTDDFLGFGSIHNSAVGKLQTVAYCPKGKGNQGQNILKALYYGNTTITDGPLLTMEIERNGTKIIQGQDTVLDYYGFDESVVQFHLLSSSEFGYITKFTIYAGTETGETAFEVPSALYNGNTVFNIPLRDLLDTLFGSAGQIPVGNYFYLRSEMETFHYTPATVIFRTNYDIFHALTNPIWLKITNTNAIEEWANINQVTLFPNPAVNNSRVFVRFAQPVSKAVIRILSTDGKVVFSESIENTQLHEIATQNMVKGVYFIEIKDVENDVLQTKRLIVL